MKDERASRNGNRHYYAALRGVFGDWIYYCCLMPVSDVAMRVSFADEIHKSKKLSEWIQRQLQKGRSTEISDYLRREKQRFFNSLVVAIYGGDPAWHGFSNFRPTTKDIDLVDVPDEVEDSVGLLSFTGDEHMFAVDGQHRLAGMKEAIKADPALGKDEVSLLLVAHQRNKIGLERSRRLFTTLNKTAKPVGKGDIIALDENDVMAIVTRFLVENDPWFSDDRIRFSQADNLSVNAPELTTIGNLYDLLTILFTKCMEGTKLSELRFIRPDDDTLGTYREFAQKFFRNLAKHFRPLKVYFGSDLESARRLVSKYRTASGGHILFRPIGLRIFVEIAGALVQKGRSIEEALDLMSGLPVHLTSEPYKNVIWLRGGKMNPGTRVVCRRLLLHMLGYDSNPQELQERYAKLLGEPTRAVRLPKPIVG